MGRGEPRALIGLTKEPGLTQVAATPSSPYWVCLIDGRNHQVLSTIEVGRGPVDAVYAAGGDTAFVSSQDAGTIVRLDGRTGAVRHTTDPMPLSSPFGLAVDD